MRDQTFLNAKPMVFKQFIPQKIFLFLGGFFGIIFLLVTPPFQVPDEFQHFLQAYNLSEGRFKARLIGGRGGDNLPTSLSHFDNTLNHAVATHPENKQDLKNLFIQFKRPLHPEQRQILLFPDTARYAPLVYLPQALGILPGRLLEASPPTIFYLGRLTNLLVWLVLVFITIRLIPFFKWVIVFLVLTPMSLFQAASLSADGLVNGIALLTIAVFLHLAFGPVAQMERRHLGLLLVLGLLLAFAKQVYVLLLGLFFLIPRTKFKDLRHWALAGSSTFIFGGMALLAWYFLYMGLYPPEAGDGSVHFAPREQLFFILEHPWTYSKILWATLKKWVFLWMAMFVGILGWIDTPLPRLVYYTYYPVLSAVVWGDNQPTVSMSLSSRLTALVVFMISLLGILTSLYLTWNRLQAPIISGLQGRYLIPIAPLAVIPFYRLKSRWKTEPGIGKFTFYYLIAILSITVWTMVNRYYIG